MNQNSKFFGHDDVKLLNLHFYDLLWNLTCSYPLNISHTSANRVEYTLTSVNKDLQTSITMLPTKVTRFKTYTRKLQKIYYKVFYVCSK